MTFSAAQDGVSASMTLDGDEDESMEYAIIEDATVSHTFSVRFLKLVLALSSVCEMAYVGIKQSDPLTVRYDLEEDSRAQYHVAPCIQDNE